MIALLERIHKAIQEERDALPETDTTDWNLLMNLEVALCDLITQQGSLHPSGLTTARAVEVIIKEEVTKGEAEGEPRDRIAGDTLGGAY